MPNVNDCLSDQLDEEGSLCEKLAPVEDFNPEEQGRQSGNDSLAFPPRQLQSDHLHAYDPHGCEVLEHVHQVDNVGDISQEFLILTLTDFNEDLVA